MKKEGLLGENENIAAKKIFDNIEKYASNIAIINDHSEISYRELHLLIDKQVSVLMKTITSRSIVVGLRFEDPVKHLVTFLALLKVGITQCSIDCKTPLEAQKRVTKEANTQLVIQDMTDASLFFGGLMILDDDYGLHPVRQSVEHDRDTVDRKSISANRPALVFMGSGTTGDPKMIAVNSSLLWHQVDRDLSIRNLETGERHYSITTLDYYTAKRRALGCLLKGAALVLPANRPARVVAFCKKYEIDHLSLTTSQAISIVKEEQKYSSEPCPRLPQLKTLFVGSSSVSESVRRSIRDTLCRQLFVVYGSNEFGEATIANPEEQERYPGTVGKPCPGVSVEIVDEDGKPCQKGTKGRIRLWSEQMMDAYVNNSEASKTAFTKEGYYPGDLGYLTPDGQLIFSGREDDMMIFSGVNIYPREIEQVLEDHPSVIESAAFPLTVGDHEGTPHAAVRAHTQVSEKELLQFCRKKLGWKSPYRIFFAKEFPRNAAGKILKQVIAVNVKTKLDILRKQPLTAKQHIPKIIHQSYHSRSVHPAIAKNIEKIKKLNPDWEYRFYDDADHLKFISKYYPKEILDAYNSINPLYGAARADFFRYLLIYKVGGVWLDIKSTIKQDLNISLRENDLFILSQWDNKMGESFQGFGLHPDLAHISGGEFETWHIISAPGNLMIKAVIQKVLQNINSYSPEKFGIGKIGVWRTTGPIAYTLAIVPLLKKHKHRFVNIGKEFMFQYTIFKQFEHKKLYENHYSELKEPIILR